MRHFILFFAFSFFIVVSSEAAMKVCYGSVQNCFYSNGDCSQLDNPCASDPDAKPWLNGCLCVAFVAWQNPDENDVMRYFRIYGEDMQIKNADDTWTTYYDAGTFGEHEVFTTHFIDELDRIVITVYEVPDLENFYGNGGGDLSSIVYYTLNVSYDDEYYE